jgi:hypothetical protein
MLNMTKTMGSGVGTASFLVDTVGGWICFYRRNFQMWIRQNYTDPDPPQN